MRLQAMGHRVQPRPLPRTQLGGFVELFAARVLLALVGHRCHGRALILILPHLRFHHTVRVGRPAINGTSRWMDVMPSSNSSSELALSSSSDSSFPFQTCAAALISETHLYLPAAHSYPGRQF